ncbi:MAG: hypothetical protein WD645_00450 [Dehalococcoidia bacterium]
MRRSDLAKGMQVTLDDGSLAEVVTVGNDDSDIVVRYVDTMDNPAIAIGSQGNVAADRIIASFMGTHAEGLT